MENIRVCYPYIPRCLIRGFLSTICRIDYYRFDHALNGITNTNRPKGTLVALVSRLVALVLTILHQYIISLVYFWKLVFSPDYLGFARHVPRRVRTS